MPISNCLVPQLESLPVHNLVTMSPIAILFDLFEPSKRATEKLAAIGNAREGFFEGVNRIAGRAFDFGICSGNCPNCIGDLSR